VTTAKASSTTYTALCEREGRWWVVTVPELPSGGVTQARTLDEVPVVVADLVATMTGADRASVEVNMRVHAGPELRTPSVLAALATVGSSLARRLIRADRPVTPH
jgi:hypothetical protein